MQRTLTSAAMTSNNNRHSSPTKATVTGEGRDGLPQASGAAKRTAGTLNRERCIGENENADRISFENRVQEIMALRN